ncbi:hypothetical protein RJ640_025892 [Escallonia rubra]|uniref:AMP-dependent synthetase/ligase domain-containing protein n=1 Tax=Escallonia rubra TaxID=112253 RepID=A0AA88SHI3_9ASTE|nr:hypothetical protein RJ640_025892 [Escallonia rubra]
MALSFPTKTSLAKKKLVQYTLMYQLASYIRSFDVQRDHVVSVVAPNIPVMYKLHFAAPMADAVLNIVNTRLDSRTISVLLRHSESKILFVDHQSTSLV